MTTTNQSGTKVFISYSHNDKRWLSRLNVHIAPLKRQHSFAIWDDTTIKPGMKWDDEIREALASVRVAVLLVSADFLASEYIYNNELPVILNAAAEKGATILSVIISPCLLSSVPALAQIQSVNDPKNPLINLTDGQREELFVRVAELIAEKLNEPAAEEADEMADSDPETDEGITEKIIVQMEKQIELFATNKGKGRFLLISIGETYVQLANFSDTDEITFEAVSNKFLPKEYKLKKAQVDELLSMGFNGPDEISPNFYMDCVLDSREGVQELAAISFDVLYGIHGIPLTFTPSFEYGYF